METAIGRYHSGIFLETVLDVAHENEYNYHLKIIYAW